MRVPGLAYFGVGKGAHFLKIHCRIERVFRAFEDGRLLPAFLFRTEHDYYSNKAFRSP